MGQKLRAQIKLSHEKAVILQDFGRELFFYWQEEAEDWSLAQLEWFIYEWRVKRSKQMDAMFGRSFICRVLPLLDCSSHSSRTEWCAGGPTSAQQGTQLNALKWRRYSSRWSSISFYMHTQDTHTAVVPRANSPSSLREEQCSGQQNYCPTMGREPMFIFSTVLPLYY